MASGGGEEEGEKGLSDVEDDVAVEIGTREEVKEVSIERFREVLGELEKEKKAREAAEKARNEIQASFHRLKALAHEAIKKRDEAGRGRDEAVRNKEEVVKELEEVRKVRDELVKQRDEAAKEMEDLVKGKEELGREVETGVHMLVTGIEKISGKVSGFKSFSGGLPRSQKYTGLPAVAYGVIKRTNEIVEELMKQIGVVEKARNEARETVEQRNYEIAIEVSQLEATIGNLREELEKKNGIVEGLEKEMAEMDVRRAELEKEVAEKLALAEKEGAEMTRLFGEYEEKLRSVVLKMDVQRPLLVDQLNMISKIHDQVYDIIKIVDGDKMDHSELSESLFLPKETDMEENIYILDPRPDKR